MSCAFCAQARDSQASALQLSRVTWPEFALDDVVDRLARAAARGSVRRACLQVTVTADSFERSMAILGAVKQASDVPFDVAIRPQNQDQVRRLLEVGADHVGFGLDAASEAVFRQVKGGDWAQSVSLVENAARAFPGRVAVHLIVGLGETEKEMVERIQWAHDRTAIVGLFAFTPVRGTKLAHLLPPPLAGYRRMQAVRWLIVHDQSRAGAMAFDKDGRLVDVGAPLPATGDPFRTSGCPDCNRPFYNEQPAGLLYNYPRPLTAEETALAVQETEIEIGC
jgi:biotin synthase